MIETKKQREKRIKAEAPLRAKRAADYARKMNPEATYAVPVSKFPPVRLPKP